MSLLLRSAGRDGEDEEAAAEGDGDCEARDGRAQEPPRAGAHYNRAARWLAAFAAILATFEVVVSC